LQIDGFQAILGKVDARFRAAANICSEGSAMRGEMIEIPNARLRVDRGNDDPATIFVHGFGGDMHTWDDLWRLLPDPCGHMRYDLRGYGKSRALSDDPFQHSADLLTLMNALQIERCNLVGASMGGSIALNFALTNPDRVRSLGLLSTGLTGWEWSEEWQALWMPIIAGARDGEMSQARQLWLGHPLFQTTLASRGAESLQREVSQFSGDQWIADHQAAAFPDIDRLHELKLPVLMLTGARDLADFRLIADVIEASINNVTRHDAPHLGHMIHLEDPLWCRDRLAAFWDNIKGA
jgi:pimeloyl-ACP methyl ester carboxylesterase